VLSFEPDFRVSRSLRPGSVHHHPVDMEQFAMQASQAQAARMAKSARFFGLLGQVQPCICWRTSGRVHHTRPGGRAHPREAATAKTRPRQARTRSRARTVALALDKIETRSRTINRMSAARWERLDDLRPRGHPLQATIGRLMDAGRWKWQAKADAITTAPGDQHLMLESDRVDLASPRSARAAR
jgi:hypothetical protein